jgi:aminoglycoside phosphotransferase (APT) family kinase protein
MSTNQPPAATPEVSVPSTGAGATDDLALRLGRLLGGAVENLARLSGGASRETWAFDLRSADGSAQHLILRRDPPLAARVGGMLMEAELFGVAANAGVPVPRLLASGDADPAVLGTGFLVMERVDGETLARRILRDEPYAHARTVLVEQMGTALARLHSVDKSSVSSLDRVDTLAKYREALDTFGYASPTFEMAFRWLDSNRPERTGDVILHGDFRLGNVIVDGNGLAAVLDWELGRLGDPAEDLAWLCVRAWRFGGAGPVAGLSDYEVLLRAYKAAGGADIPLETLRWWEAVGTLAWGVMCLTQANAHISGAIRSVELAAIGRRVAEQEHDLLDLMGVERTAELPTAVAPDSLTGAPTLPGLVEAVREFVERDVMTGTSGRVQFHARVAANVLAMIERELALGPGMRAVHAAGLATLGVPSEEALAEAVRSGRLDYGNPHVRRVVRSTVSARLAIANPKYA